MRLASAVATRLHDIYPAVAQLVGRRRFRDLSARLAEVRLPPSCDAIDQCAEFSYLLEAHHSARAMPYLPDLARLEWAIHLARSAARVPSLPVDALDAFRVDEYRRIVLFLQPSWQLFSSQHSVLEIYLAIGVGTCPLEIGTTPSAGLPVSIQRLATRIGVRALDADEYRFLAALRAGVTVGAARPDRDFDVHMAIARLAVTGALVGYAISEESGT